VWFGSGVRCDRGLVSVAEGGLLWKCVLTLTRKHIFTLKYWIPAFAGMTGSFVGMMGLFVGVTDSFAGVRLAVPGPRLRVGEIVSCLTPTSCL